MNTMVLRVATLFYASLFPTSAWSGSDTGSDPMGSGLESVPSIQTVQLLAMNALEPKRNSNILLVGASNNETNSDPLIEWVIERLRQASGKEPDAIEIRGTLAEMAMRLHRAGEFEKGVKLAAAGLKYNMETLGKDHPKTLISIYVLADFLKELGRQDLAGPLFRTSVLGNERVFGRDHAVTLRSVYKLAELYAGQQRYAEAAPFYQWALQASDRLQGAEHPNSIILRIDLALSYRSLGRYDEAEVLLLQALEAGERVWETDSPDTLKIVSALAAVYRFQYRTEEAEQLFLRVMQARKRSLGVTHNDTLSAAINLAFLYEFMGRYDDAEREYGSVLKVRERVLGSDHASTLRSANYLGRVYQHQGRYGEAEVIYQRTLDKRRQVLGKDHPDTLESVNNLAGLYLDHGRFREAEDLYLQAADASNRAGEESDSALVGFSNLVELYYRQANAAGIDTELGAEAARKAEQLASKVLKARVRLLGEDYPATLNSREKLAQVYRIQRRFDQAEPLQQQVLMAREKVLSSNHPDTLLSLNNLAGIYQGQKRYKDAERLYLRALTGLSSVLGDHHPRTLRIRQNLSRLYLGQPRRALEQLRLTERGLRYWIEGELASTLSETDRRQLLKTQSKFQDIVFTLALRWPEPRYQANAYAADVLLRWKGLAREQEAMVIRNARGNPDPDIQARLQNLAGLRAALSFQRNQPGDAASKQRVMELSARIGALESQFRQTNSDEDAVQVALAIGAVEVGAALPPGSALVELRQFIPIGDKQEVPHMLALLLPSHGPTKGQTAAGEFRLRDLGQVQALRDFKGAIDVDIAADRSAKHNGVAPGRGVGYAAEPVNSDLYQALFGPWDALLASYSSLYIAPDGWLQLIPFASLRLPNGRYWVESQQLHRVSTGRDLLLAAARGGLGLWAVGGVDYQRFPDPTPAARYPIPKANSYAQSLLNPTEHRLRRLGRRGEFRPLPGTATEARSVAGDYQRAHAADNVHLLLGRNAAERHIKTLRSPHVLHMATHGFYDVAQEGEVVSPMTQAGLVLAGGNLGEQGADGEDGILYASEVLDMDLQGTELVTLSACDTGKGELDSSEGVYGLVRAFHIAGARNVLMSLWAIDDESARIFMSDFYRYWLGHPGSHPADALRATQLAFISSDNPDRQLPVHWAAYVLVESGLDAGFAGGSTK